MIINLQNLNNKLQNRETAIDNKGIDRKKQINVHKYYDETEKASIIEQVIEK